MKSREEILRWLACRLEKKRLDHCLAVEQRATELAAIHGGDSEKAALAGLLHDCCHSLPKTGQLKIIESHAILLDDFTLAQPQLWHAIAGSIAIREELCVKDPEIISAVRWHTTGRGEMTKLEQIVYLADLTSADRFFPDVGVIRTLSEQSLIKGMLYGQSFVMGELSKNKEPIVRDAWEAYNYFWHKSNVERNA